MFKRRALLVASTKGTPELPMAAIDVKLMKKYLRSFSGGMWLEDEISVSIDESRRSVLTRAAAVRREKPDYFLFYWSGHGLNPGIRQILVMDDTHGIVLNELFGIAPRQLMILDTCRADEGQIFDGAQLTGNSIPLTREFLKQCRACFDACVQRCERSLQIAFSCEAGSKSYSTPLGGCYTTSLIQKAMQWDLDPKRQYDYKSINTLMRNVRPMNQQPKYYHSNHYADRRYFPFSVRINPVWS